MNYSDFPKKAIESVINHAVNYLTDGRCVGVYGRDLHSKVYNEDYFVVYHSDAKDWLTLNEVDEIEAIETIREYEIDNFGETTTKINPESVVNMYAYILGEVVLSESKHLDTKWDVRLTERDCKKIAKELEKILN